MYGVYRNDAEMFFSPLPKGIIAIKLSVKKRVRGKVTLQVEAACGVSRVQYILRLCNLWQKSHASDGVLHLYDHYSQSCNWTECEYCDRMYYRAGEQRET